MKGCHLSIGASTLDFCPLDLAHQELAQLTPQLRSAVRNCWLQAYFRVNRLDAEQLAKEAFAGVYSTDKPEWEFHTQVLQSLPNGIFAFKNKSAGGVAILEAHWFHRTAKEEYEQLGTDDVADMGADYLRERKDIEREYLSRSAALTSDEPEFFRDRER